MPSSGAVFAFGVVMVDVSLTVMARTNSHQLPARKEAGRWRQGEIVECRRYHGMPENNEAFFAVHVTGCPGTFEEVKQFFETSHEVDAAAGEKNIDGKVLAAKRARHIDFTVLNVIQIDQIRKTKSIVLRWDQLTGPGDFVIAGGGVMRQRAVDEKPVDKVTR
jgi:hypothetical protein